MASFGVYPCEDPTNRAAHAAITIRELEASAVYGSVALRFAIDACEAPVRQARSAFVMDERPWRQGEAALDSMLTSMAPDAVVVSRAAAQHLKDQFELEELMAENGGESIFRLLGRQREGDSR